MPLPDLLKLVLLGPFAQPRRKPMLIRLGIVAVMTLLTEVGGLLIWPFLSFSADNIGTKQTALKWLLPISGYLLLTKLALPVAAGTVGSVPLPCKATREHPIEPRSALTCLLARNYARPQVREGLMLAAKRMSRRYERVELNYLDAGFPFRLMPMLPHAYRREGLEVDMNFLWKDVGGRAARPSPSPLGYGHYVEPREPRDCPPEQLYHIGSIPIDLRWELSWMQKLMPERTLDVARTRAMVGYIAGQKEVLQIMLEPHLHGKLGSKNGKTVANPCKIARHDDHFNVRFHTEAMSPTIPSAP
jgi:hypothetical protein